MQKFFKWGAIVAAAAILCVVLTALVLFISTPTPAPQMKTVSDSVIANTLTVDGYSFHVKSFGDTAAPAVIVLHDGPGHDMAATLALQALADSFHVFFFDQRASGLSQRLHPDSITFAQYLSDLTAIANGVSPEQNISLIGLGWGAIYAASWMSQNQQRVDRAVLIEPMFLSDSLAREFFNKVNFEFNSLSIGSGLYLLKKMVQAFKLKEPDPYAGRDYLLSTLSHSTGTVNPQHRFYCTPNPTVPFYRYSLSASMAILGTYSAELQQNENASIPLLEKESAIKTPTLLLTGTCNSIFGAVQQTHHLQFFTTAKLQTIENAGHDLLHTHTSQALRHIRTWLSASQIPVAITSAIKY